MSLPESRPQSPTARLFCGFQNGSGPAGAAAMKSEGSSHPVFRPSLASFLSCLVALLAEEVATAFSSKKIRPTLYCHLSQRTCWSPRLSPLTSARLYGPGVETTAPPCLSLLGRKTGSDLHPAGRWGYQAAFPGWAFLQAINLSLVQQPQPKAPSHWCAHTAPMDLVHRTVLNNAR